jgi:hypothetical protein
MASNKEMVKKRADCSVQWEKESRPVGENPLSILLEAY